jgi:hypothetical protein
MLQILVAMVVTLWPGLHLPPRSVSITTDKYERVQIGMTRMQVEAIMGAPPGDYRRPGGLLGNRKLREPADPNVRTWVGDTLTVMLLFDDQGRVLAKLIFGGPCLPGAAPEPPILDRLRRLLPW